MGAFLKDLLTKDDGESWDPLVIATAFGMISGTIMTLHRVFWLGDQFDAYGYFLGFAALVAATGIGQRQRDGAPKGKTP